MNTYKPELSVVIPIFDEEENIFPLLEELTTALDKLGRAFEIICVDDASRDHSREKLADFGTREPRLKIVFHRRNCGESAATASGFHRARGRYIITMDGDLQNDPADIPNLLARIEKQGVAAVCGVRRRREDDWVKRLSSRAANTFRNLVTGDRIRDAGCTFRILRRDALREIPIFNGMHRFLPTLLRLQGYEVEELLVNHRLRRLGVSKYGIGNRLFRGLVDCLAMRWWQSRCVPGQRCRDGQPQAAGD
ncbi:MAG TPA: glycosyltransferase [Proteobacteria bacterium]|nr:glycosyltransferase [Pseudomonadota bacterium]